LKDIVILSEKILRSTAICEEKTDALNVRTEKNVKKTAGASIIFFRSIIQNKKKADAFFFVCRSRKLPANVAVGLPRPYSLQNQEFPRCRRLTSGKRYLRDCESLLFSEITREHCCRASPTIFTTKPRISPM